MGYTALPETVTFDGVLFDMDGTIIDSTSAVVKHWHSVGNEIGVDPELILQTSHGRRSMDILRILCPKKANWEYVCHMEGLLPMNYHQEAVEIPGARSLLEHIIARKHKWAIVTSGTVPLVVGWLDVLKLPHPEHLVTAESVENGKPDPSCYIMGREKIGLAAPSARVVVVEDSPAGIEAGKAAGCKVIGLVTSHVVQDVLGADWIVKDLSDVRLIEGPGEEVTLEISNAFVKS
ncbi:hypothetical protein MKZ38_000003 [Zalerion maritima]|uniref:Glycerol-3-phosphate phosphatase n=1 Tax=Zalerion maritima TaxID=339359 RepID=A0AAD5RFS2_9PEZI|nr:hypothetical protein MKZ38_000003 [Zalerion maritima]